MKGYPKHIATAEDYENLLTAADHRDRALKDLSIVQSADTAKVKKSIVNKALPDGAAEETEDIPNPAPLYKVKGFKSREDVEKIIRINGGEVADGK